MLCGVLRKVAPSAQSGRQRPKNATVHRLRVQCNPSASANWVRQNARSQLIGINGAGPVDTESNGSAGPAAPIPGSTVVVSSSVLRLRSLALILWARADLWHDPRWCGRLWDADVGEAGGFMSSKGSSFHRSFEAARMPRPDGDLTVRDGKGFRVSYPCCNQDGSACWPLEAAAIAGWGGIPGAGGQKGTILAGSGGLACQRRGD